jgi:hypothetical protein
MDQSKGRHFISFVVSLLKNSKKWAAAKPVLTFTFLFGCYQHNGLLRGTSVEIGTLSCTMKEIFVLLKDLVPFKTGAHPVTPI